MEIRRIVDENDNELENPDLSVGYLVLSNRIKKDAEPIDDETKFAWADDDWEEVYIYKPFDSDQLVAQAKNRLAETDYVAAKAMDKLLSCTSADDILEALNDVLVEYKDVITERAQLRKKINDLES